MENQENVERYGSRCGIVYVAAKKKSYLVEALISADSAKLHCPGIPITLFTDYPENPLSAASCFDNVIGTRPVDGFVSKWAEGQLSRILCLLRTPYEFTLHLDTDTRIVTDELPRLFDSLKDVDVAMVETTDDDSFSRVYSGKRMFNGGVILYRRNDLVLHWLEDWSVLSERNFRLASQNPVPYLPGLEHLTDEAVRRKLLCTDQIALVEILSPEINVCGLKVKILDYCWNHRGSAQADKNRESPRIVHYSRRRVDYRPGFEAAAERRLTEDQIARLL